MMKRWLFYVFILYLILSTSAKSRSKRFILYNGHGVANLGLILLIPFSVFLPGLGPDRYTQEKLDSIALTEANLTTLIQPGYEEQVANIESIFCHLKITARVCQERIICQMASNPDAFFPVSSFILNEIKDDNGPIKKEEHSIMWRYHHATAIGKLLSARECQHTYGACDVGAEKIFDSPYLNIWKFAAKHIDIKVHNN